MPFSVSWTTAKGSKKFEFETAAEVLNLYVTQNLAAAVKLVIKDDRGQRLTPDDIVKLVSLEDN